MKLIFKNNSRLLSLIGLLLCLPVVWSYLQPHFFHLHDFTHVSRLVELEQGILDGQFPVRWSQNLGYGYGMPQFSFYGPLFYYEALFFRLFHISFIWSVKLTVIFQVLISFMALFKLGELLWGKWGGFLTAIAGIYAPYRLVNMYVRGAFGELSGMTFVALTLYSIVSWAKKPTWKHAALVSMYGAGILLSHNLVAIVSAPFLGVWLLFWMIRERISRFALLQAVIIVFLTLGLSAYYSIPAFFEKDLTQAGTLTTGYTDYNNHFLYIRQFWNSAWGYGGSFWGIDDGVTFEIGKLEIVVIGMALLLFIRRLLRKKDISQMPIFMCVGIMTAVAAFLCILKSKFLWDKVPLMAYIQFPWRYLLVIVIFSAILMGALVIFIPLRIRGIIVMLLVAGLIIPQIGHAKPESYLDDDNSLYYANSDQIQTKMSGIIPDFLPRTAQPKNLPIGVLLNERFMFTPAVKATTEVNKGHEFLINFESNQSMAFTARIFDFPGWTLYLNGEKLAHTTTPEGLIQASISANPKESYLSGRFEETPLRAIADGLTVLSLMVIVGLCYPSLKKKETL